ncbi:MAG: molybdopterin-dependent oxidoreductase [Chloroflexi bacterium]|nr:molybdopterin-dependent oxidoreductase [Chloroflexota bacterium]
MPEQLAVIGKGFPLKDAYEKVTGSLEYAVDVVLPGMLHAKVLRSPHAHARIAKIDTSRAESLPGVGAVITYRDVPREEWSDTDFNYRGPVLDERVRYYGDEVAAAAARDQYVAERALRLIEVEYEELPHVFDLEEALSPDAPRVTSTGNVKSSVVEWGDIDAGFRQADLVVEHATTMGNQQSAPLGRNACVARWNGDKLTVWTSTQVPFQLRDRMAAFLKMPESHVRVIGMPTGASFGLWWLFNFHFMAVFLAKKSGRPVKLDLTQEESFATVKRRERPISWVKLGVRRDGSFTAIHFKHLFDNGGYGNKANPYESVSDLWARAPSAKFEMYGVSTNLLTAGCMRGVGDVTMNFSMEETIDKAAEQLAIDPLAIRIKNHVRPGDQMRGGSWGYAGTGVPYPVKTLSSCGLDDCIERGAQAVGWKERWRGWGTPVAASGSKRRGLGMAIAAHICGEPFLGTPSVIVKVNHDGSVNLLTGVGRMGQGADTTQAQIVAEELGVSFESISGAHGDTDTCPWSVPSVGSTNAHMTGLATRAAAADAKRQILQLAGDVLEARPEDMDIKNGMVYVKELPERRVPISQVTARVRPEYMSADTIVGRAARAVPQSPVAKMFMAHFVEVEVDTITGDVRIIKYVAVHDSGRIINPEICQNQVSGGVLLGSGFGLMESLVFDEKTGRILNPNYVDYKIFTSVDLPDPEISFVEVIDPVGAFGVKSLGEGVACPAPAAVAQAIHNATAIRFNCVPITPEMILGALKGQKES